MNGTLRAQWRVFCNLCPKNELVNNASINTQSEATRLLKTKGWHRARHGLWTCPQCAKNIERFLRARQNVLRKPTFKNP